jgi:hypothetical protein
MSNTRATDQLWRDLVAASAVLLFCAAIGFVVSHANWVAVMLAGSAITIRNAEDRDLLVLLRIAAALARS